MLVTKVNIVHRREATSLCLDGLIIPPGVYVVIKVDYFLP